MPLCRVDTSCPDVPPTCPGVLSLFLLQALVWGLRGGRDIFQDTLDEADVKDIEVFLLLNINCSLTTAGMEGMDGVF